MKKRHGKKAHTRSTRTTRKTKKSPARLPLVGRTRKIRAKTVGKRSQLRYDADEIRTDLRLKDFENAETRKELIRRAKFFRKATGARRTRMIVEFEVKRRGKKFLARASVGRSEPESEVNARINYSVDVIGRSLRGYARVGFKIGKIRKVILERVARATKKKKR